ncbi:hypothetical protein MYSTI_06210 [Myxococcus stipitatus DSM 14675]|uniref:Uncharacterized protein n=1 Tax=Myxococcus stipitatus (strain DSM 14675 / JCM 12634 / Mx s8) TaxID=1278073 RepID=L7UHJ4_MYXSD|nr:hypothetical protein [Myxococcus stipitatus]AGC47483.1 hypothetical protein MYSTI_06210 [Myxococcus stipitatus DSM 14675]
MLKLVAVAAVGAVVLGTMGLSGRVDARPGSTEGEPTQAQVEAALDARQKELLGILLEAQRTGERTASVHR